MGIRTILGRESGSDETDLNGLAVIYDSTTGAVFGRTMQTFDEIEAFLAWCREEYLIDDIRCLPKTFTVRDRSDRTCTVMALQDEFHRCGRPGHDREADDDWPVS